MRERRRASDSTAQRDAEAEALVLLGKKLRVGRLVSNRSLAVGNVRVSLDGFYESPKQIVLLEINARIGKMKTATRNKVCKDALKMAFVCRAMNDAWRGKRVRTMLVFLDDDARASFGPRSWANAAFDALGVETHVCQMGEKHRRALLAAQLRQDLRFNV